MKDIKIAIDKVNELEYISNVYKAKISDFKERLNLAKETYSMNIDEDMEEFLLHVNGKAYYDCVVFKSINSIPVLDGCIGDIGLFYSLLSGTQYDMLATKKSNHDIIKPQDYLLAEATPGDFLVISFAEADYGKIYFISHDSNEDEEVRYLVANNIKELIDNMFVEDDEL